MKATMDIGDEVTINSMLMNLLSITICLFTNHSIIIKAINISDTMNANMI